MVFFFKQKTAYDVRISDWSSDLCSSDLADGRSGDVRDDLLVHPVAHACADHVQVSAASACPRRRHAAAVAQSAAAFPAWLRNSLRTLSCRLSRSDRKSVV